MAMTAADRARSGERARQVAVSLRSRDVRAVALTWVDNTGVTRVKAVPVGRLEEAATWGVGMSPVFDVFLLDDSATSSRYLGGPTGDLRLFPDLDRATVLSAQPGWAWAPVDRYSQDGGVHPACQRSFARRMVEAAGERGLELQMGFEIEWFVGREELGQVIPGCTGPAYGMTRLVELSEYARDLLAALEAQGVQVCQFHPEYAPGQLELSLAAADPVAAADLSVLVRATVRAISQRYGLRVSFAPVVVAGQVGNGGHLHLSAWDGGRNLFAGGTGRYGLTDRGESVLGGLLEHLPALLAVGAPSVASYLRLVPSHWAGVFQCWGRENREAALRLVTGSAGCEATAANAEVKCFDASANPYLVVGSVLAITLAVADRGLRLPPEVTDDPAGYSTDELAARGVRRLPQNLPDAVAHLERCQVLREAMGAPLFEAILAVRGAETELFAGRDPQEIVAATRWVH